MKGEPAIIEAMNEVLTAELTAINQYFIHHKMCENWGYQRLASKKREESIEEMKHADAVIGRILYFDGIPNMQRLSPIRIGENPVEQHKLDLALETEAVDRLNKAIALCRDKSDNGSRELLEGILVNEEAGLSENDIELHFHNGMIDVSGERHRNLALSSKTGRSR